MGSIKSTAGSAKAKTIKGRLDFQKHARNFDPSPSDVVKSLQEFLI